jgi:CheY-like chemotaxis protein
MGTSHQLYGIALVVDDEKSVLKVCTKMVTLCGFKVIGACDGLDAVTKFRERAEEIDVVLMDLTMPNMDGLTAMGEMYAFKPDARIIIASGFNEDELSERITSPPPAGFVRKPYSMQALEAELRRVVPPLQGSVPPLKKNTKSIGKADQQRTGQTSAQAEPDGGENKSAGRREAVKYRADSADAKGSDSFLD